MGRVSFWIAAVVLAVACRGGATDRTVRQALDVANISSVRVDVDEDARIVRLQGTVGTLADRVRAEEIAAAVVGTSGRVVNDLTVEGLEGRAPEDIDGRITDALDRRLDDDRVLRERDVNVHVASRVATIIGEV